jgi:hypothetical protein
MNESWYTKFKMITGAYPGLYISSYYKKEQERFAKTVTIQLAHIDRVTASA